MASEEYRPTAQMSSAAGVAQQAPVAEEVPSGQISVTPEQYNMLVTRPLIGRKGVEKKKVRKPFRAVIVRSGENRRVTFYGNDLVCLTDQFKAFADRIRKDVKVVDTWGNTPDGLYGKKLTPNGLRKDRVYVWFCPKPKPAENEKCGAEFPDVKPKAIRFGFNEIPCGVMSKEIVEAHSHPWSVVKDERGQIVAYLSSKSIYLPISPDDAEKDGAGEIIGKILDEAAKVWSKNRKDFDGKLTLSAFNDFCGDSLKKRRSELESKMSGCLARLRDAEQKVMEISREYRTAQREIEMLNPDEVNSETRTQFKYLHRLVERGLYEEFRVKMGRILGKTAEIIIEHKGKKYPLGQYIVCVDKNGSIEIEHFERRDPPHPHIRNTGGSPCWGNISGDIPKLIGMERYGVFFQIAYEFLCSYNESNPYHKIERFSSVQEMMAEHLQDQLGEATNQADAIGPVRTLSEISPEALARLMG